MSYPKGAYTSISASNNWEGKWTENLVCLFPGVWCLSPLRELLGWCSCPQPALLMCGVRLGGSKAAAKRLAKTEGVQKRKCSMLLLRYFLLWVAVNITSLLRLLAYSLSPDIPWISSQLSVCTKDTGAQHLSSCVASHSCCPAKTSCAALQKRPLPIRQVNYWWIFPLWVSWSS